MVDGKTGIEVGTIVILILADYNYSANITQCICKQLLTITKFANINIYTVINKYVITLIIL